VNRLALVGYGRMGRLVEQLAPEHGFEVVLRLGAADLQDAGGDLADRLRGVEAAVDFSTAAAVPGTVERLAPLGVAMVVGTTGWHGELERVRETVTRHDAGLLHGANFAIGVQVFYRLAETAARLLAGAEDYGAWLYEIHHDQKKDAPSGTLREIRRTMEAAGYRRPIDIASNRAGKVPGTHRIGFDSEADTIVLEHSARGRAGFARGALLAARWMLGRPGFYEFSQVWEEIIADDR
jgi:4-hydroxy-tetrahydrodipicolinate reductase